MEKEKVVFFMDYANINRAAREKRYRLDYHDLLQYVGEERFLIDAHCYVPINPRNEHRLDREIEELWRSGYIVNTKLGTIAGGTYKCNFDVELTMDMLKAMYQVKPDIIVLASGDSDFVSLIHEVRKSGVRVEVAAFKPAELFDSRGRPVKITTIPDRTKGMVTYGGERTFLSKQTITEQVYDIAEKLFKRGVSFDEEHADWMIANQYVLPPIWHHNARSTALLIIFPTV